MRRAEFKRLAQQALSEFPDLGFEGGMLYVKPVGDILCSVQFESTDDADRFYANAAVQPLFVPREHAHVKYGGRFPGLWTVEDGFEPVAERLVEAIKEHALPLFHAAGSLEGFVDRFGVAYDTPRGELVREESVYCLVLLDDPSAETWLERLVQVMAKFDDEVASEASARAETLLAYLHDGRRGVARKTLEEWRTFTLRNILPEETER